MKGKTRILLVMLAVLGTAGLALTVVPALADVSPPLVGATLGPGESLTVTKTVSVPEVPPKLDLVLDVDLSGSYFDDLPNIKAKAPDIFDGVRAGIADSVFGLVTFVDYPFSPWGSASTGDYAYARDQDLTADKATWTGAVDAMFTRFGGDGPESQYTSLHQAATGAGVDINGDGDFLDPGEIASGQDVSFRSDATKVIAITTDASFHSAGDPGPFPYPGPSRDDTVAALNAAGVKVIAIKAPGSGSQMDDIAAATGGAVTTTGSSSSEIATAILGALEALTFDVTATPVGCDPLVISFSPASHTGVSGGSTVTFDETISVPAGLTGVDMVECTVEFKADDTVIGVQTIRILLNRPPDCSAAAASPNLGWPPNHKLVPVEITGVTDPDGDAVTITPTGVTQDEPVFEPRSIGAGSTKPDATLDPLQVRVERAGTGDGRVYHIAFTADDGTGGTCTGDVHFGVPHDQGAGATPIDSAPPSFDSTAS